MKIQKLSIPFAIAKTVSLKISEREKSFATVARIGVRAMMGMPISDEYTY